MPRLGITSLCYPLTAFLLESAKAEYAQQYYP